jgi:hypothetical protein
MSKTRVLVIKDGRSTLLTNPAPEDYAGCEHVIAPDLSEVRGTPPDTWSISNGRVVSSMKARLPKLSAVSAELPEPQSSPSNDGLIELAKKCAQLEREAKAVRWALGALAALLSISQVIAWL